MAVSQVPAPASRHRAIAAILRERIVSGEYPPGSVFPTEPQLGEEFGVHRNTIGNAVKILRAEGLVRVIHGRGTTVRTLEQPIRRNAATRYLKESRERNGGRGAFDAEVRALGYRPGYGDGTRVDEVEPPADVAAILGTPPGEKVIRRSREMYANDEPVQLAPSYIPLDIARGTRLAEADSGEGGIISRFAELGFEQVRITEAIRARLSTEEERTFLHLDEAEPVLEIMHVGWTANGRAVEVAVHAVPSSTWILDYEFTIS